MLTSIGRVAKAVEYREKLVCAAEQQAQLQGKVKHHSNALVAYPY
jgi:hypothetical protein